MDSQHAAAGPEAEAGGRKRRSGHRRHPADVKPCPRCGQDHLQLMFKVMKTPGVGNCFAVCPVTQEPIVGTLTITPLEQLKT